MAIKVVSFDLDNTLWENHSVIVRAEQAIYEWLQQEVPELTGAYSNQQLAEIRQQLVDEQEILASQMTRLRKLGLQRALQDIDYPAQKIPSTVDGAFEAFIEARNNVQLFPEAVPVLQQLKNDYTLASLTNGNSDIELIGIDHYFGISLSAEEVGRKKPAPDMYQELMRLSKAAPHEIVHVGDHEEDDVAGAGALGIHTIWFNPDRKKWPGNRELEPGAEVASLGEIPGLLLGL